jgi:hypothetical protein
MNYLKTHTKEKPWTRKSLQEEQIKLSIGNDESFPLCCVQISKGAAGKY